MFRKRDSCKNHSSYLVVQMAQVGTGLVLQSEAEFPFSVGGKMKFQCYKWVPGNTQFVALIAGGIQGRGIHMRIHDACLTSEVFGSCKCDCRHQLVEAQRFIGMKAKEGSGGLIVYTFQEGRGIGLANKIAAYELQERLGLDTVEANEALGLPVENRSYDYMPALLARLKVESVVLMTNNPFKIQSLASQGLKVEGRQPVVVQGLAPQAAKYLETKGDRMGHRLGGVSSESSASESKLAAPAIAVAPCPLPSPSGEAAATSSFLRTTKSLIAAHAACHDGLERPFVTLTFAQSLDGSIATKTATAAGSTGVSTRQHPLQLSGLESMAMTHGLRAMVSPSLSSSVCLVPS
jgi:GTP cyclohydrolase II